MADIKLVIKIPEEEYGLIVNDEACGLNVLTRAIAKGTPLPKGHGILIDANALTIKLKAWDINTNGIPNYAWKCIREMPTIIEADNGESEVPFEVLPKEKGYECAAPKGMLVGYGYCNGICEECEYGKTV